MIPSRRQEIEREQQTDFSRSSPKSIRSVAMESTTTVNPPPLYNFVEPLISQTIDAGPFQVIEPGSDLYDPNICFDPDTLLQEEIFFSENGIPQDVLEEVFRAEDEIEASTGFLPSNYPVPSQVSLVEYEAELVSEMERLFPEKKAPPASRLMEELTKSALPDGPCYMTFTIKEDNTRNFRVVGKDGVAREQTFCVVDLVDGKAKTLKAKYYETLRTQKQTNLTNPPLKTSTQPATERKIIDIKSPQLKNISPAMASKIESLASGTRSVTLTPVRVNQSLPKNTNRVPSSCTTIVIKAPKRTIASNVDGPTVTETGFQTHLLKEESSVDGNHPLETEILQKLTAIDSTRIEVPVLTATGSAAGSKQPRKQKLHSLVSQCEMNFEEAGHAAMRASGSRTLLNQGKAVPRQREPPNDFVTVTIKDTSNVSKKSPSPQMKQLNYSLPARLLPSAVTCSTSTPLSSFPFKKRIPNTLFRTKVRNPIGISNIDPSASIEILDSSEDESSAETTTTAPESENEDIPKFKSTTPLPKIIKCIHCNQFFTSVQAHDVHTLTCTRAEKLQNEIKNISDSQNVKGGTSLLRCSVRDSAGNRKRECNKESDKVSQEPTAAKKKRSSLNYKRSERLSIEILPTAFSINNLLLCNVCQKSFRTQEHLDVHQKIHMAPIICKYCKKKFSEPPPRHICQEKRRSMS